MHLYPERQIHIVIQQSTVISVFFQQNILYIKIYYIISKYTFKYSEKQMLFIKTAFIIAFYVTFLVLFLPGFYLRIFLMTVELFDVSHSLSFTYVLFGILAL